MLLIKVIYRVWPMTTKNKNRLVVVRDGKYMYIYDCILEEIGWSEVQIIWLKKKYYSTCTVEWVAVLH